MIEKTGAAMVRCVSPAPATTPKPRVRLTEPPQFMCGWCGKWDTADAMRTGSVLTGNNWPIHSTCYMAWYEGEPRP